MTAAAIEIRRSSRIAVLWGGGLGDLLTIRPLLQRLAGRLDARPLFACASFARPGMAAEAGIDVDEVALPATPAAAAAAVRALGALDLLYLGPHPTWRTRLLARAARARRVWAEPGSRPDEFIGETVCRDTARLGLGDAPPPYGTRPLFRGDAAGLAPAARPYLIVHSSARPHWQAKQWPAPRWRELLQRLLDETALDVMCVGTPSERAGIEALASGLPATRVRVECALSLTELERRVGESAGALCHNSGVMHVACALGKPTVALAGSSPRYWWPSMPWALSLTSGRCGLECNQYRCPVPFFDAKCIRELDVDTVHAAVRRHVLQPAAAAKAS